MSAGFAPHAASVTAPRSTVRADLLSISHLLSSCEPRIKEVRSAGVKAERQPAGRAETSADRPTGPAGAARPPAITFLPHRLAAGPPPPPPRPGCLFTRDWLF